MVRIADLDAATVVVPKDLEGAIPARDILDEVHGLDNMMCVASEMLIACALIIEREAGADEARYVLNLAGQPCGRP